MSAPELALFKHISSFIDLTITTALPYHSTMVFIETSTFTKLVSEYLTDEEYLGLQNYLMQHPNAGVLIPQSGGVRKLRWALEGRGKRGGVRAIYYWKQADDEIWMITLYAKNEISTIPGYVFRKIAEEIKNG